MPPNPRVDRAFRAMKALGISGEKVKPVLKSLLRLYNKNWDLIEAENYRVLADAIFDNDEAKDAESKYPTENAEQEALVQDEPEPPLKRQRVINQSSQQNESLESHLQNQSSGAFDSPRSMGNKSQPGLSPLVRNKGKQPISSNSLVPQEGLPSSQPSGVDKSILVPRKDGSTSGSGIPLSPAKNAIANHTFVKPKDEPITDDLPHLEVPVAIICPGSSSKGKSPVASGSKGRQDDGNALAAIVESDTNDGGDQPCPGLANGKPETNTAKSPSVMEIASSQSGDVKIILNYGSALGRSDFHMPRLDAVVKLMEAKCKYKELDPNFSVMKVMTDVCQCFWEAGSKSTNKSSSK